MPRVFADSALRRPGENNTGPSDVDESLVTAFDRAVKRDPLQIALDSGAHRLSYKELNEAANRLTHRLIGIEGSADSPVAILMEHDAPAVVAVVGILKAGRIVLALNASDPVSRLRALIEDAEPRVIVSDSKNRQLATDIVGPGCEIVTFESDTAAGPSDDPAIQIRPEQPAALVYTSGATGRPKGVVTTHRQLRRMAAVHTESMQYSARDRIPLFSVIGTGHGSSAIWCALANGARLCPFPARVKGVTGLADWIVDRGLTVYVSSASIFRALVATLDSRFVFSGVRAVRLSSESVTAEDVASFRRHFPSECTLVHTLSCSETGNIAWSRWTMDDEIPSGRLPVGRVSRDIELLLLGEDGQPVTRGEVGEISVKSRYVAAGYWRDPELTAKRFSEDIDGRGTRIVRTGDWARINLKGDLEFCGRKDDRVNIRGNRIELAEIELALKKLPGIADAAVVVIPREKHEGMLVAFVVLEAEVSWSASRLRHALAANLPFQMVPSRFVFVESLPLGAGGKINREALRDYRMPGRDGESGEPPRTETEMLLADIWAEALDLTGVGRNDDFFSLGGDSLKGAVVAAQIHAAFGVEVNLAAIAGHPNVSTLASFIDKHRDSSAAALPPITPVARRGGPVPLTCYQQRLWTISQDQPDYVFIRSFRISGPLDVEVFKGCLAYLADRHESLRTTYKVVEGSPVQTVNAKGAISFSHLDATGCESPENFAASVCVAEAAKPIEPSHLPLTRHLLIKMGVEEYWLFLTIHPLAHDGWSNTILTFELAALYEAAIRGADAPLPKDMPVQYIDYAAWHNQHMKPGSPAHTEILAWWKRVFSKRTRSAKLPFRRTNVEADLSPSDGVIPLKLNDLAAARLDGFARGAGVTHFIARVACFIALVADINRRSTLVFGTYFANRNRIETRNIVGVFANLAPLVFTYRSRLAFGEWMRYVRDRVFETEAHGEIPFDELYRQLLATGLKPSGIRIIFSLAGDLGEQRFGGLTVARRPYPVWRMPWGCQLYFDERAPENSRVDFDAHRYPRPAMQAMIDRYLRLLDVASRQPNLTIGKLVAMSSDNALRRAWANRSMNW